MSSDRTPETFEDKPVRSLCGCSEWLSAPEQSGYTRICWAKRIYLTWDRRSGIVPKNERLAAIVAGVLRLYGDGVL